MNLKTYFENTRGTGIISTADSNGRVNSAVYARPHVFEDGTIAHIMRDRLTHANLMSNPYASYLFIEEGAGYKGKRLYMTMIREEKNADIIAEICKRCFVKELEIKDPRYLMVFRVEKERPLIGSD